MDDFELEPTELTGALISMEFGPGGRIQQLWVAESANPEGSQEFQFICPPLEMAEEVSEDYFPGTILIGARTHPEEPWILSRNANATRMGDPNLPPGGFSFEYELGFLEELSATGRFYEIPGPVPQIAWDVTISNRSRRSVEVGELGFPLALNNVYEGFPRTDDGTRELFHDRVYVHKFIGGAASYIHAQRMNGRPPGLMIFPGEDTRWEFYSHVPASLNTPFRWEGIPVVYVLSRAAIEREGWPEWFFGHSSVILEPEDSRTYRMRFAATDRFQSDTAAATLVGAGRPVIGLMPAAVAPRNAPITLDIAGCTPATFATDVEAELETDADEEGGTCTVSAKEVGPIRVSFEDTSGRESETSLLFTLPIETLIERRAEWIVQHQFIAEGQFKHAIVAGNTQESGPILDLETFVTPFGIESGLADALFLAEKNTLYPNRKQIQTLDSYLSDFLEGHVVNPGDMSVGSLLPNPHGVAVDTGRPELYAAVFCLYDAMAQVSGGYGAARDREAYLRFRDGALHAMTVKCALEEHNGIPLMSYVNLATKDTAVKNRRLRGLRMRRYPFNGESLWSTTGFEEAFCAAREHSDSEAVERFQRYALSARSLSPCWWWYGSDKRWLEAPHGPPHPGMADKGEMCLGPTSAANSVASLAMLDRDNGRIDPFLLRKAFGGMMGVWALVREDGAASMGFCPDESSKQYGMSWTTGDAGIGLFHYLRNAASYVMASRAEGLQTFGCHFESIDEGPNERFLLKPWDGVGRRVVVRHLGLEVFSNNARIREVAFDAAKRNATVTLKNPADKLLPVGIEVVGLWGDRYEVDGNATLAKNGRLKVAFDVPGRASYTARIKAV